MSCYSYEMLAVLPVACGGDDEDHHYGRTRDDGRACDDAALRRRPAHTSATDHQALRDHSRGRTRSSSAPPRHQRGLECIRESALGPHNKMWLEEVNAEGGIQVAEYGKKLRRDEGLRRSERS